MIEIGFLVFPQVQQLDVAGPYEVLAALQAARLHMVSSTMQQVFASSGLPFSPTVTYDECLQLNVLCIPGGKGINALMTHEPTLSFIRQQAELANYITSVCTGALVLGAAGLLVGKRATTHWNAQDLLPAFGAIPVRERVVRDGQLLTGGGVTAGIDFALTLAAEIAGQDAAECIQLSLEYAPAPPFEAGSPECAREEIVSTVLARGSALKTARTMIAVTWQEERTTIAPGTRAVSD